MRDIKSFPTQKLSMFKKTQAWKEACVDYIIGSGSVGMGAQTRNRQGEMQELYDLYNGIYDEKNLKHVTNPFKQADQFPATAQDYNIIKPKIDVLLGEETKRPFNFKVCRTSDIATGEIQEIAKKMLEDYLMATIMSKLSPEKQQRYQEALASGEIQQPEAIAKYITKDYKDIAESAAHHTLNYLKLKLNLTHEFYKGWEHALIGGEECYYVGIRNGEPFVECRNPMRITYETFDGMEFIHEAAWCCYEMDMSATEIYDNFYDKMTEKQLNELLELIEDKPGGRSAKLGKSSLDYNHIEIRNRNTLTDNPFDADHIKVWHCCWKSFKKIGFVSILNPETEEVEEYQVDENYKETGLEESVEWKWIIEIWEGYRIGKDMYLGIQPLEYQHISMENPNAQKLPYTGAVYNNLNTKPRSLVSIMKPLQYMYIILWYRLELAIARDKGKVAVMDVTQIPKNMGIDTNKWMHYLSALGVAFVNPYETGWEIPGREGGRPSQFNQMQAWDLSMSNVIAQYIQLMDKIEDMLAQLTGITPQRQGAISSSELVGNVERSVIQSSHITEPWFWVHNQVKKQVLTMLLDTAKFAWKGNKKSLHYVLDDATRAFINLSDQFFNEDMDVFVDDSTKENQQIEMLRNLMQPAMQNGASLLDIAEIITLDNVNLIKQRLQEIEEKRMQQMQEQQQREQEMQMQLQQAANEAKEEELMLKEAELDLQKYKIDQDNATKITVAQLNAYRGSENMDQNNNNIPDPIEIAHEALEERKQASDEASKQFELNNKRRELEMKREMENKQIELERERMQHEMKLQKAKDDAAMQREKLKARTAIRNKVVGESKKKS